MNPSHFSPEAPGKLVTAPQGYHAFVPNPLPPAVTPTWALSASTSEAERALTELRGIMGALPAPDLLIAPFVRREAVLSSRIEGTRASLADLLSFEAGRRERPGSDTGEVANYVTALNHGVKRLASLPLSLRFIRELHGELLRGAAPHLTPGEFRRSQNWTGRPGSTLATATFVPPPPAQMQEALSDFEEYLHAPSDLPVLVRLGLIHYQFEAIHPFLDGNGRVGRLLVTFLLHGGGSTPAPVPYFSAFIDRYRVDYYRLLLSVSQRGTWDEWLEFFLNAIRSESQDAVRRGTALLEMRQQQRARIGRTRAAPTLLAALDVLVRSPIQTVASLQQALGVSTRTAQQTIARLRALGLIEESTGQRRNRVFVARAILELLEADTV